ISKNFEGAKSSRPPLVRMLAIHNQLAEGRYPNCFKLSRELEVATKTIHRDIEFMRDQLNLPLAYDRATHGYYYTEPVSNFPTVQVSHGELVALLIAQKAVEQYRGTAFEKPLQSAFAKLASGLQGESGIALHELTEAISFRTQGLAVTELDAFQTLAEATLKHREVSFSYRSLKKGKSEPRRVRPYHLGCLTNQWYLIGLDTDREAVRTFALARLQDVVETGETFKKPEDFSVADMFSGSFSAFQSGKVEQVVLKLDAFAARLAAERAWHPSQRLEERKDGSTELRLEVSIAPDLENWILSWGEHAEVLKPKELRTRIAASAKAMAKHYKT
ncbi:MAG TPA: WYL domain-containing protein, partial [Chthoniobacterales bacterium]|nr:WYL domain-containing protein [Chthoniobacterales bacterium]